MYEIRIFKGGRLVGFTTAHEHPDEDTLNQLVRAFDADFADVSRQEQQQ